MYYDKIYCICQLTIWCVLAEALLHTVALLRLELLVLGVDHQTGLQGVTTGRVSYISSTYMNNIRAKDNPVTLDISNKLVIITL